MITIMGTYNVQQTSLGNLLVPRPDEGGRLGVGPATPPCKTSPSTETANTTHALHGIVAALCSTGGEEDQEEECIE